MLKVLTILTLWLGLKWIAMSRHYEHIERLIDTEVKVGHILLHALTSLATEQHQSPSCTLVCEDTRVYNTPTMYPNKQCYVDSFSLFSSFQYLIESTKVPKIKIPITAPIRRLTYSVQVLAALKSSSIKIEGSFWI